MEITPRLERAVELYCGELRNKHKKQRRYTGQKVGQIWFWDLPCAAAACSGADNKIYKEYSRTANAVAYGRTPILKDALLNCVEHGGKIGDKTNLRPCSYPVGQCAEPHAARECIKTRPATTLDEIHFSFARCIRTGELKDPCAICMNVFPNLR